MNYGLAMKQRVLRLYDQGYKTQEIAHRLCVCKAYCRRVKQFRHLPPKKIGGSAPKLNPAAQATVAQWIQEKPDSTLEELRSRIKAELGISICIGALWNTLRRMKFSFKKKSQVAAEQLRPDVQQARDTFFAEQLKDVPLEDLVVLDESYATTTFTRLRGRCLRNRRLQARVPHGHWKTLTMIAAITVRGVLAAATIDAATDAAVFQTYITQTLGPALRPGMVVVMDNLAAHRVPGIRQAIEAAGCRLVYLPPYSPDFSPIENIWSKVKQELRTRGARDVPALLQAIGESLQAVTAEDCRNCFVACGYATHDVKVL